MKYIDLFGGIGGFSLGLEKASKEFKCVGYYEIDKYAVQTYNKNFGTEYEPTDIRKVRAEDIPDFDVLCAGFPCQAFSIAGKRLGFKDTRGTLFYEIARIIKVKRPRFLFLENVKGLLSHNSGRTFATILATLDELGYDAEWQVLNSKYFGVPQNRERIFIIGHLRGQSSRQVFPIRQDEQEADEDRAIVRTITGGGHSGGLHSQSTAIVIGKKNEEITGTLTAGSYKGAGSNGMPLIRQLNNPKHSNDRVYGREGISPALNTAQGGNRQPKIAIPVLTPDRENKRQNGRRFKNNGEEMFTLTGQDKHGVVVANCVTPDAYLCSGKRKRVEGKAVLTSMHERRIRRLTPHECERLQSFPDDWTEGQSDTQRYKQLGNAVTVNVIEEIAKKLDGIICGK